MKFFKDTPEDFCLDVLSRPDFRVSPGMSGDLVDKVARTSPEPPYVLRMKGTKEA